MCCKKEPSWHLISGSKLILTYSIWQGSTFPIRLVCPVCSGKSRIQEIPCEFTGTKMVFKATCQACKDKLEAEITFIEREEAGLMCLMEKILKYRRQNECHKSLMKTLK